MTEERTEVLDESQDSPDEEIDENAEDQEEVAPGDTGDVEEEEGAGEPEEELDGEGVPWKNRAAEYERKFNEANLKNTTLTELLKEKTKPKETERGATIQDMLESIPDAEFEALDISKKVAALMRKSQKREVQIGIQSEYRKADKERADVIKLRQETEELRVKSIHEVQEEVGDGEFGGLIVKDTQGVWQWDAESELYKRTAEIFNSTPSLRQRPDGQSVAARKAMVELTREKYGKTKAGKDNRTSLSRSQRMLGKGKSGGKTGKAMNSEGKFYRKLSLKEYDQLSREDRDRYNVWETLERIK